MKTKITIFMLLCIGVLYAQVPSINPTVKSLGIREINIQEEVSQNGGSTTSKELLPEVDSALLKKLIKVDRSELRKNDFEKLNKQYDFGVKPEKEEGFYELLENILNDELSIADYSFYINSYKIELEEYKSKISDYEKERYKAESNGEVKKLTKSIKGYREKIKYIRFFSRLLSIRKNKKLCWFPSTTWSLDEKSEINYFKEDFFKEFYNEDDTHTNYLNNISFLFGSTTVQSELISDYAGAFRFSFGTVITAESDDETDDTENPEANDESQENDLQRIINGGGNFYLTAQLPVYARSDNTFLTLNSVNARIASDIEGVGADVQTSNVKYGVNLSSYLALATDQKKFNFFVNAEYGWINGSGNFRDDFGLQDVFKKPAFIGKAIVGIMLDNKVTITVTSKSFSNYNSLVSEKVMVGIQLLN